MLNNWANMKSIGWIRILLTFLIINTANALAQSNPVRIGFLCPAPENDEFWGLVITAMEATADDLDIDLTIKYIQLRDVYTFKRLGDHFLNSKPKIDYLITKYVNSVTNEHIKLAQKLGIKVFVINSDVPKSDFGIVGKLPREKYANWIGHLVPNGKQAGYDLTQTLVKKALQSTGAQYSEVIHVFGMETPAYESTVNQYRKEGLISYVKSNDSIAAAGIEQIDPVKTDLEKEVSKVLMAHPDINVVWTSYDQLAWYAVQALEKEGRAPGKNVFIGSFDWSSNSIKAIADGRITASMTGHFMEGAWALILLYDYHNGIDFDKDPGLRHNTRLSIISADNLERYQAFTRQDNLDKIDFKMFSKKYNPDLKKYNFDISQFIN